MHLIICQSVGLLDRVCCQGEGRGLSREGVGCCFTAIVSLCLHCFCFAFKCLHWARISRQSVALSARHSGPQKSRPQLAASTLCTPHCPLFGLSPLGTRHSHGTLRGWSILPLARHLQICAPCTLTLTPTRTHIHSKCTHSSFSHKKPFKQCQWE